MYVKTYVKLIDLKHGDEAATTAVQQMVMDLVMLRVATKRLRVQ